MVRAPRTLANRLGVLEEDESQATEQRTVRDEYDSKADDKQTHA